MPARLLSLDEVGTILSLYSGNEVAEDDVVEFLNATGVPPYEFDGTDEQFFETGDLEEALSVAVGERVQLPRDFQDGRGFVYDSYGGLEEVSKKVDQVAASMNPEVSRHGEQALNEIFDHLEKVSGKFDRSIATKVAEAIFQESGGDPEVAQWAALEGAKHARAFAMAGDNEFQAYKEGKIATPSLVTPAKDLDEVIQRWDESPSATIPSKLDGSEPTGETMEDVVERWENMNSDGDTAEY